MRKWVYGLLGVLLLLLCSSCMPPAKEEYMTYICKDYHLTYRVASSVNGQNRLVYDDKNYDVEYRTIKDVPPERFVAANTLWMVPLSRSTACVMQPADATVSPIDDWTIDELQLYYVDFGAKEELWKDSFAKRNEPKIRNQASDEALIAEFLSLDDMEKLSAYHKYSEEYTQEFTDPTQIWHLRVCFSEEENIVWDARIESYIPTEGEGHRLLYLDWGRNTNADGSGSSGYVALSADSLIYKWISNTMDADK